MALPPAEETTYQPISTADAVLRYAGDFIPSGRGHRDRPAAGRLVFMMMVAQTHSGRTGLWSIPRKR